MKEIKKQKMYSVKKDEETWVMNIYPARLSEKSAK